MKSLFLVAFFALASCGVEVEYEEIAEPSMSSLVIIKHKVLADDQAAAILQATLVAKDGDKIANQVPDLKVQSPMKIKKCNKTNSQGVALCLVTSPAAGVFTASLMSSSVNVQFLLAQGNPLIFIGSGGTPGLVEGYDSGPVLRSYASTTIGEFLHWNETPANTQGGLWYWDGSGSKFRTNNITPYQTIYSGVLRMNYQGNN